MKRAVCSSTSPAPASCVSRTCESMLSSPPSTPTMPPCAQAVAPSSRLRLASTTTGALLRQVQGHRQARQAGADDDAGRHRVRDCLTLAHGLVDSRSRVGRGGAPYTALSELHVAAPAASPSRHGQADSKQMSSCAKPRRNRRPRLRQQRRQKPGKPTRAADQSGHAGHARQGRLTCRRRSSSRPARRRVAVGAVRRLATPAEALQQQFESAAARVHRPARHRHAVVAAHAGRAGRGHRAARCISCTSAAKAWACRWRALEFVELPVAAGPAAAASVHDPDRRRHAAAATGWRTCCWPTAAWAW